MSRGWVCKPCAYDDNHLGCWDGQKDSRTGELLSCTCDHAMNCETSIHLSLASIARQLGQLSALRRAR